MGVEEKPGLVRAFALASLSLSLVSQPHQEPGEAGGGRWAVNTEAESLLPSHPPTGS